MKTLALVLSLMMLMLLVRTHHAEEIPKFGKVPDEELQMTAIPEDPHADAVYLFDVAALRIMDDFTLRMKRRVRIKILTEEGKEQANVKIRYWHEDDVDDIKAHTILPNGKKIKLDNDNIFEEEIKNRKQKVFSIPGVEVGSVIEYKYELRSEYLHYLEPWYFQHSEYTKLSRISAVILPGFRYQVFFMNTPDIEPTEEEFLEPGRRMTRFFWTMRDLPPVKKEPYMRTINDYLAGMQFQLISFKNQYVYHKWIQSWSDLIKKKWDSFEKHLDEEKILREKVAELAPDSLSGLDKAKAIYNYVRENIQTTGRGYTHVEEKPEDVYINGKGSGTDKNMLLVNLLRTAGLEACPVLISTRSHGKVWKNQPLLTHFNYVIAYLTLEGKEYFLDTRDKYCPFNLLPVDDLVDSGLLIREENGGFVEIPGPKSSNMAHCATTVTFMDDSGIRAESHLRLDGYRAYKSRKKIHTSGEKEFVEEMLKDRFGIVEIDSFKIKYLKNLEVPLYLTVNYRIPDYAQAVGNMIYMNAPVINNLSENPFKREKRYFPVEFPYQISETDDITIQIPEGYQIAELPQKLLNRNKKLMFMNVWTAEENTVRVQRHFIQRDNLFTPYEYRGLRSFYDRMVGADQGQIVLSQSETLTGSNE